VFCQPSAVDIPVISLTESALLIGLLHDRRT